jgi:hypothetical protein
VRVSSEKLQEFRSYRIKKIGNRASGPDSEPAVFSEKLAEQGFLRKQPDFPQGHGEKISLLFSERCAPPTPCDIVPLRIFLPALLAGRAEWRGEKVSLERCLSHISALTR